MSFEMPAFEMTTFVHDCCLFLYSNDCLILTSIVLHFYYRYNHKVLSLKEEGDLSAINQAYNNEVAKSDKRSQRDTLSDLCQAKSITRGIIEGKKRRMTYSNAYPRREGCALGFTISMAENSYMTDEAWVEITPNIVVGYRHLPFVLDNSQWWVLELLDGFGSNTPNIEAIEVRP